MFDLLRYDETSPSGLRWSDASKHHKRPAGSVAGTLRKNGYWQVGYDYKYYLCHRVVWCLHNGEIPDNLSVDHVDRDPGNNTIENLRLATPSQQQRNRKRKHLQHVHAVGSRFKGVLHVKGKSIYVGTYDTEQEAYNNALARRLELYWAI